METEDRRAAEARVETLMAEDMLFDGWDGRRGGGEEREEIEMEMEAKKKASSQANTKPETGNVLC